MDKMDLRILSVLQSNPEMPVIEIAAEVGMSHTPCWRRIKRLESDGVIKRRIVLLNASALGLSVNVLAEVRLRQHDEETLEKFEGAVRKLPQIVECFSMSGDSDYLMRIVIGSIDAYEAFLKKVLLHLPAVASINSNFALNCVKMTTELPILV